MRHGQISSELAQATAQAAECERRSSAQIQAVTYLREESGMLERRAWKSWRAARNSQVGVYCGRPKSASKRCGARKSRRARVCCGCTANKNRLKKRWCIRRKHWASWKRNEHDLLETSIKLRDDADQRRARIRSGQRATGLLKQKAADWNVTIRELRDESESHQAAEPMCCAMRLSGVRARHSTLTQILNDRSYTADAVQKLFAANERGGGQDFRAVGVLADYAEVEEHHEAAIEQYLRDELEYVVVETFDHARAGVSLLRNEVGGRATFFVDSLRNLRLADYEPIINFRVEDGVISRLDKLVEFRDPLGEAAKQFLPRLKAAYLADSAVAAEKLARENPQFAFVTPDGTCYQGRMVTGGRADEAGPLGMKRELRALDAEVMQLEHQAGEKQVALEAVLADSKVAEKALEDVGLQQREADHNVFAARHRHQQMQGELARLGLDLTVCQNELQRIRQDVERARTRAERAREEHAAATASRAEAETERTRLSEQSRELRGSVERIKTNWLRDARNWRP